MSNSITESVARLHRAGSEHSQQTQKLREAVDSLIEWLMKNIPAGFSLPCDLYIYPSGEIVHQKESGEGYFKLTRGEEHNLFSLHRFAELIEQRNFLEKLSTALEVESRRHESLIKRVASFLIKS